MGPSGAGKSTLLNALSGRVRGSAAVKFDVEVCLACRHAFVHNVMLPIFIVLC